MGRPTDEATDLAATVTRQNAPTSWPEPPVGLAELAPVAAPGRVPDLPAAIGERYQVIRLLGRGGMGVVYQALDRRLGRDVALKLLLGGDDPDFARRLLREARSQARLDHENACHVYEAGVADGQPYLVMQRIDGVPFSEAAPRLTLEERVMIVRRVAPALHEAHRLGLVHRDVKPSNILVEEAADGGWKPYLVDFGIARLVSELGEQGQTITGTIAGTPAFMAPEQARGDTAALDRRTDVYGLGATLYAALAGHPPFVATSAWEVLRQVKDEEAPSIRQVSPAVPADLEAILVKCLEKEPHRRYDSAKALGDDLQRFLDGDPVLARRLSPAYAILRKALRHKVWVALAGAALAAVLVVSGLSIRARRLAGEQTRLAQALGEDVKEMELFLRSAYELPLHDVERERDRVRARLLRVADRMAAAGRAGLGPGHYALGRGHLALQEPDLALPHLEAASAAGYASPELDYALGLTLGELMSLALAAAKRIDDPARRKARVAAVRARYQEPALLHLRRSLHTPDAPDAPLETAAYVEGLIALYDDRPEEALAKAALAFEQAPWLYEAKKLEGDARFALGSRFRHDEAFDYARMMDQFRPAAAAYRVASTIARSDPRAHLAECALWDQIMNAATARRDTLKESFAEAQAACGRAIAASSRGDAAHLELAFVHVGMAWWMAAGLIPGDPREIVDGAVALAEEAARRSPGERLAPYVMGHALRAQAYHLRQRGLDAGAVVARAIAADAQALRVDPTFVWAENEIGVAYQLAAANEMLHGVDPGPSLESALAHSRRAGALDPGYLYARNAEVVVHLLAAEHLVDTGRDPEPALRLVGPAIEAGRALSEDWPPVDYFRAYAHWIQAAHDVDAGHDPSASLDLGTRSAALQEKRAPGGAESDELSGKLEATRAAWLLQRGDDPGPSLHAARASFRHAVETSPWEIAPRVWSARVEILALRAAARARTLTPDAFAAARAPLLPLLDQDRADPALYEALATIDALDAASRGEGAAGAAEAIEDGLRFTARALALNPHRARAQATRGTLLLARARAARPPRARTDDGPAGGGAPETKGP
jgi:hypothetical protein